MNIDLTQIVSLADFAKANKVVATSLAKWIELEQIKPVMKLGNTNGYMRDDLIKVVANNSNSASVLRSLGYVHPDIYKAVEDHRDRLIQVTIERDAEIEELKGLLRKLDALEAAGVDNWDGYDHAMSILRGEDDEYDNSNLPE